MSSALKCDRCGMFFERQLLKKDQVIFATVTEDANVGREIRANLIDLCPDCLYSLAEWFNGHAGEGEDDG